MTGAVDDVNALLEINGALVDIDDAGNFLAVVDLDADVLVLSLAEHLGETTTIRIPVDVLVENGGEGVLNDLIDAGVTVDVPVDGFEVIDDNGPILSGNIVNADLLHSATVNGINILNRVGPNGGFFSALPWPSSPSQHVTMVVVDRRGVAQTTTFRTTRISSTFRTRAGTSVSSAGARGVVIVKVRLEQVDVAVEPEARRRGHREGPPGTSDPGSGPSSGRHAFALPRDRSPPRTGFTNRFGQATFAFRLRPQALASCGCNTLVVQVRASTARAAARKAAATRMPRHSHHVRSTQAAESDSRPRVGHDLAIQEAAGPPTRASSMPSL